MTLQNYINSLSNEKQLKLAIRLANLSLPIWEKYTDKNKLSYHDAVVGLKRSVNRNLLKETIVAIEEESISIHPGISIDKNDRLKELYKQFNELVVALQDSDWELPDEVLKTFYAVYNLIDTLIDSRQINFSGISFYVSINQAIDALDSSETLTSDQIDNILDEFSNKQ